MRIMKKILPLLIMLMGTFKMHAQKNKIAIGDNAPALHIEKWIKGSPVTKFEKGKVYLVDISIIFCPGCIAIIPELTNVSQKYRGKAEVFVVYSHATPQHVKSFAERMGKKMDYGVSVDTKENLTAKEWGVSGFPKCFIVNQEGKIAYIGGDVDNALESIIKTGQYTPDPEIGKRKQEEWIEANKIWNAYQERKREFHQKGNYKALIHLIDSLLPFASDEKKYELGKYGLLPDRFEAYLLDNDSISADNSLKEMMTLTTDSWWRHLDDLFSKFIPPFSTRVLPFNYERYLEIAERAANDGGGNQKVAVLCGRASIMYACKRNKAEALAVLNEAGKIAEKEENDKERERVKQTISQIQKADAQYQQANADWKILMKLMENGGYPPVEEVDKAGQEKGWVGQTLCYENHMRKIIARAADFWDKYPTDERRKVAMNIFFRTHMYSLSPWIDTSKITRELTAKINAIYDESTKDFKIGKERGKILGSSMFRLFPRDFKAEAEWQRKRTEMVNKEVSRYGINLVEKEKIEWGLFTSDWGQTATEWRHLPNTDENLESEITATESDYWTLLATHFWEGMWLRFNEHISKFADLPVVSDRALNFLGATAGTRHAGSATKIYWQRIAEIYGDPKHPLAQKAGILALLKQVQLQADADKAAAGQKPVELQFTAFDGREVDLAKLRGKVVLIDFWSTSCAGCLASMPHLKEMYNRYHGKGLEIISISLDPGLWKGEIQKGNLSRVEAVIKKYDMTWPQRFTGEGMGDPFAKLYSISALPTVWLLDKEGMIADKNARGTRLEPLIRKYLGLN